MTFVKEFFLKSKIPAFLFVSLVTGFAWPLKAQTPSEPTPGIFEDKYGATSTPPSTGDATNPEEDQLFDWNAVDMDIKDMVKLISKQTGTNFLIDDTLRGKITIISEKKMSKEMAYQAFLSALQVMGYTTVTTPAGLVKIIATKDSLNQPLELFKNETPDTDRFITRIIQVTNISANDIATVVKSLVSKDGNLFAYPATNSLILTDTGSNIERILKIIRELDQEGPQEVIEIIPIINADAADITEKILQLFESDTQSASARAGAATGARTRPARRAAAASGGGELEDGPSISKVINDERTNSVIVLGTKRAILKIKALIAQLDAPRNGTEGSIHVYYLKHASAKEIAEVLSSLVSGAETSKRASQGAQGQNAAGAAAEKIGAVQLEGGVKVTSDEGTNSLVITASPKDYETLIDMVVSKLDIPRRQVYLEAVVMELTVNKSRTLGLSGNLGNILQMGGEGMAGFGTLLPLTPSVLSSLAGASGGLAGGIVSEREVSFTDSQGNSFNIPAVSAVLQALQTDSNVNVLSTPSILTLDNEEAQIQVGQEVPVPTGSTVATGGVQNFSVSREDTGVILKITPQISESDTVKLKVAQEISNIGGSTDDGPIFTKRTVDTVVVANDKQTIVIGGLLDDQSTVTTNKVPLLGDIPMVGNLFKNRSLSKQKTNILVFITPYIIRDKSDYVSILQKKIDERNAFIDYNYGTGQRKAIRESIYHHAKDLLDYKPVLQEASGVTPQEPAPATAVPKPVSTTQPEAKPTSVTPKKSSAPKSKYQKSGVTERTLSDGR